MPAILALPVEQALEFELAAIASVERLIRRLHADRYRSIQRAREFATEAVGVTASSTARDRDMATRSFVAELATTVGQHEASASRLVAVAEGVTSTNAALSYGRERSGARRPRPHPSPSAWRRDLRTEPRCALPPPPSAEA
ncbi:hypothetical protein [Agromyces sp. SYSU T00266]|uniref:hypothetical protein n=1 Tax=Agromyces zhanjiangensis TaxID=3158562 RepID=UPI00339352FA